MKLLHTNKLGNKSTRQSLSQAQLNLVVFTTPMGMVQEEIVKAHNDEDLNLWIAEYKRSYSPNATHNILPVSQAKVSSNINLA